MLRPVKSFYSALITSRINTIVGLHRLFSSASLLRFAVICLLHAAVLQCTAADSKVIIHTESAMRDARGEWISDCLEPHIYKFGDTWYAYGFAMRDGTFDTTCYSSTDLKEWIFRVKFPAKGRLSVWCVAFNQKNNEYVAFGAVYGKSIQVYTSKNPTGPFVLHNELSPVEGDPGDILVYQDDDKKTYFIYNKFKGKVQSRYAYIYRLNDDYYDIDPASLCNTETVMEGFWMVKHQGGYFLFGSGLVGYGLCDNFYITAPSPLGPWTKRGLFAPAGSKTFHSQTFQGLEVSGKNGTAHVYIGHRYRESESLSGKRFYSATSVWLPLEFTSSTSVKEMAWRDQWTLDVVDGSVK